jgi:hypothetical protein
VSVEPAEVFRLLLVAIVLPPLVILSRRLPRTRANTLIVASFGVICFSYVVSLLDGGLLQPPMDALQHLSYGVAGTLVAAGTWLARKAALEERERS